MKISKLFFCLSFLLLGNSLPLHAARSKSKLLVGLAAAAGSALATGIAAAANSIKDQKVELLQKENGALESRVNFLMTKELLDNEFVWGITLGAGVVGILWILFSCGEPKEKTGLDSIARHIELEGNKK